MNFEKQVLKMVAACSLEMLIHFYQTASYFRKKKSIFAALRTSNLR